VQCAREPARCGAALSAWLAHILIP
jgi:hypothetical protein